MLEEFLSTIISHALSGEKLSVRIVQVIFALGMALVIYSKYAFSSPAVILLCLTLLLIVLIVTRDHFANFINNLLRRVFIEEVTKSDSGATINIEKFIGFFEDILLKHRNIIDDARRYILDSSTGSKESSRKIKQKLEVLRMYLKLILPIISLFLIYVLGLLLILLIFKPPLNSIDILYIGALLIIISFTILIAQGELELESSQAGRSELSLSTSIINAANEVMRKYMYGNIQWRIHKSGTYKSLLLLMIMLAKLMPTLKIEPVRPMYLVRFYVCRHESNNQGHSLNNLINNWLKKNEGDDVYFKIIQPEHKDNSTLSICDSRNIVKNVNVLTMSPYESLNIISGKDNRGKPIMMKLVRRNKDGSETTLAFISMVAWHGCLTKMRIRGSGKIQPIGKKVTVVSVFMIGLAEYVTLLDSELTLHARPVSDESIICEEDPRDSP